MADKKVKPAADAEGFAAEPVHAPLHQPDSDLPPTGMASTDAPAPSAGTLPKEAMQRHLGAHLDESDLMDLMSQDDASFACQPLKISLSNLRANSKAFVIIREDQAAIWSEGDGTGLVGLSFATTRDPALYVRNFLINAREFYVQTYNTCQEITVNLYVRTPQAGIRGRVDLPPGATITLQSNRDRTSLVGLSTFAIDL